MANAPHKDNHTLKAALRNLIEKLGPTGLKSGKKAKAKAKAVKARIGR